MNLQTTIKMIAGGVCAAVTKLFGGFDAMLTVLVMLIAVDYITGVAAALYSEKLSSKIGFRGILKKVCIMSAVALAHLIGEITAQDVLRSLVIGFYIANEGISILENIAHTGVVLPRKLINVLEQLKNTEI